MDLQLLVDIFPQVVLDGIILGFMYALIALGYTMVYGVLEFINFAHSEIFIIGAFVGVELLLGLQSLGALDAVPWPLVLLLALLVGMAGSGLLAVTVERVAYRPLRNAPRLIPLMAALGMLGVLWVLVNRTKVGTAIRAVAEDQAAASLMGINVNRIISLTFLIGGAMGGAAGVLFGVQYGLINPYSGFIPGLKAFTAAVLGGIGNIPGAMLGGIVLGLLEAFAASYLSLLTGGAFGAEYKDIFAFSVLILILIFRPRGLLGEVVRGRA